MLTRLSTNYDPELIRFIAMQPTVTTIKFGESMPFEEAQALLRRRPGSECKMREMSGNHIFEGPYPIKEDCGGRGSDITGRCPTRPNSSSRSKELFGHDVFEPLTNPYSPPPPPAVVPYEPQEVALPPNKLHRNLKKLSSQIRLGGPVCREPEKPQTQSAWAKQKMLHGDMGIDRDSAPKPLLSHMKAKLLAGSTNLFGTPPRSPAPGTPTEQPVTRCETTFCGGVDPARKIHKAKLQHLAGQDAVFLNDDCITKYQAEVHPSQQLSKAKAQEMRGNDIFASTPLNPDRC